ncbi:MAG: hypothetical protein ABIS30_10720 [Gallionella sp.]
MSNIHYLQLALNNHQSGNRSNINHLIMIIESERNFIKSKIAKDGFWFVDIPRTSSTSIQVNLGKIFGSPHGKSCVPGKGKILGTDSFLLPSHVPSFLVKDIIGEDIWNKIHSFTIVREPISWAISLWKYTKKYENLGFSDGNFSTFLKEFDRKKELPIEQRSPFPSNCLQTDYILAPNSNDFLVKNILKFEDRTTINEFLATIAGNSFNMSERLVATDISKYPISTDEIQLAHKVFARDFDILNY